MRQPPEKSPQGRAWSEAEKPRPARIAAARAGAAWAPISASRVWISAMRCPSRASSASSASRKRRVRSASAASTTSRRLSGPAGASCARRPMRARLGTSMRPPSGRSSPARRRKSVVLPTPLRPTRPTRAPAGNCTQAASSRTRSPRRKVRSSMTSMAPSYGFGRASGSARRGSSRPGSLEVLARHRLDFGRDAAISHALSIKR